MKRIMFQHYNVHCVSNCYACVMFTHVRIMAYGAGLHAHYTSNTLCNCNNGILKKILAIIRHSQLKLFLRYLAAWSTS